MSRVVVGPIAQPSLPTRPVAPKQAGGWSARRLGHRQALLDPELLLSLFSPLLLLAIWELLVRAKLLDWRLFPAPSAIAGTFAGLVTGGELLIDVRDTLGRLAVGLLLGGVPGVFLGVVMGLSPMVRAVIKPMVNSLFPIPKIAILPLIMLIFGLGELSKYVAVAIGVVFIVLINTLNGVLNIDDIYLDVAKNYGAGRWQTYRTVAIPGALPEIFTGIQLAVGVGLLVVITAEFVASETGIGYLIWVSWQKFWVEKMYSGLIVTSLLGFLSQQLLDGVQAAVLPWKPQLRATPSFAPNQDGLHDERRPR